MRTMLGSLLFVVLALVLVAPRPTLAGRPEAKDPNPWHTCCGGDRWPSAPGMMGGGMMGHGMMGGGMMGGGGSMQRHHAAMMSGIPAPYDSYENPLPHTHETVERGGAVYARVCVTCHGATGQGDGEAGRNLSPRPANLASLAQMPMGRWDPFMYWTIAEGGVAFGTAMPAFKTSLSSDEIWAVIAYIQARLPDRSK